MAATADPAGRRAAAAAAPAPAKINLYLHVLGRRADGYHLIDSLVAFADLGDELHLVPAERRALLVDGPFAAAVPVEDNLVLRAAHWLARHAGRAPGGAFRLTKRLPVAAGLGSGSADAAAALRLLAAQWRIDLAPAETVAIGADLPVCLAGHAARVGGIGETLSRVRLPPLAAVLVNPGVALSTTDVFRAGVACSGPARFADTADLASLANDLEPAAIRLAPAVGAALAALRAQHGCQLARMSGSGATCFGLFVHAGAAEAATRRLAAAHPGWWCRATTLARAAAC